MATAKRSSSRVKSPGTKGSSSPSGRTAKAATRSTSAKAHKTGSKTARGQAWTDKHSDNPSSTGHGKAKKAPSRQTSRCWPGYEPVAGKSRGEKGSCKPKAHQTASEKKSGAMAAAASKLHKSGK